MIKRFLILFVISYGNTLIKILIVFFSSKMAGKENLVIYHHYKKTNELIKTDDRLLK